MEEPIEGSGARVIPRANHHPSHGRCSTDSRVLPANERRVEMEVEKKERSNSRCSACGFRKRGKNHEKGRHHRYGKNGKLTDKQQRYN